MPVNLQSQIGSPLDSVSSIVGSIGGLNPHPIFIQNYRRWLPILDLLGGQPRLRDRANSYLPQAVGEKDSDYLIRIERSMLRDYFQHGIGTFSTAPFSQPVVLTADSALPPEFERNVDAAGSSLTVFAERVLRQVLTFDLVHIGVFLPAFDGEGIPSRADFEDHRLYPYLRLLPTPNVYDWVSDARETIVEVREIQYLYDRDHTLHPQVLFYDAQGFKVLKAKKNSDGKDVLDEDPDAVPYKPYMGTGEGLAGLPIVQCYASPPDVPMLARPPFADCAQVNLEVFSQDNELNHYESTAMTRFQVLKQINQRDIQRTEATKSDEASADNFWVSSEQRRVSQRILVGKDGDIFYVAPGTEASEARTTTIRRLVEYIESRFAFNAPTTPTPDLTATQTLLGTVSARAQLRSAVAAVDEALTDAVRIAYRLMDREPPSNLSIVIDRSYEELVVPNPGSGDEGDEGSRPNPNPPPPPTTEEEGEGGADE